MVAPRNLFSAKISFGVAGVKKFCGVSLENHFMHSFTSPDRPQKNKFPASITNYMDLLLTCRLGVFGHGVLWACLTYSLTYLFCSLDQETGLGVTGTSINQVDMVPAYYTLPLYTANGQRRSRGTTHCSQHR